MQYDLVFEGGGAKGIVFVGALQAMERRGHTYGRLLGTSAGSIMATFTAAGYDVNEMLEALCERDENGEPVFKQFMAKPPAFTQEEVQRSMFRNVLELISLRLVPDLVESRIDKMLLSLMTREQFSNLFSLIERGGWYSADRFIQWAQRKLDEGTYEGMPRRMSGLTLKEFYQLTGKELSLVAADTTSYRKLVLNHRTAPHCPVVWAMRMSMSLPLVWQEVIWQSNWGTYMGRDLMGHRIVDGGLLSNFPIQLFLSRSPYVMEIMGQKISPGVLGFLIDENLPVAGAETPREENDSLRLAAMPLTSRILGLINTVTQAHDKMLIDAFDQYVCRLPAKGYGTTEFDMTDERRDLLIAAGQAAVYAYFQKQEARAEEPVDEHETERALNQADHMAARTLES